MGCILCGLSARCAISPVKTSVNSVLYPLGFGMAKSAEAVTHAARIYVQNLTPDSPLLKLVFTNAFNSLRRDKIVPCC